MTTCVLLETLLTHEELPALERAVELDAYAVGLIITQSLSDERFASVCQLPQSSCLWKSQVHCTAIW
jgi:hypothetical protein